MADLFFDDWGVGSNLDSSARLADVPAVKDAMDPTWINAGASVLGKALSGSAGGPSRADASQRVEQVFDSSGWNVNFGAGAVTSDRQQLPAVGGGFNTTAVILIVAGLVAWKIANRKH